MRPRTQLSRADLLKCLQIHGEAQLEGMAAALGYTHREAPKPTVRRRPPLKLISETGEVAKATVSVTKPKGRFYRVVAQRQLEPVEVVREEPDWFRRAKPFREASEIRAVSGFNPPSPPPLMRWSRLWPFLKTASSVQQTMRALDVPLIVERLARLQTLWRLPRKQRRTWAGACQLIIDYAAPLLPFWKDFNDLPVRLQGLRGHWGLRLIALPDGDPGDRCWLRVGCEWQTLDCCPVPGPNTAVLVLSDLGCLDPTDLRRRQWRRLGLRLQRAGCRPVALMPCPPRWWDGELNRLFYPVCWDRAEHPPRRLGTRRVVPVPSERPHWDPGAEKLLALLAPAIRIEPALLRAVRNLLPAREADVGSEAVAWNHPSVHATALAFYYEHDAIPHYRHQFQQNKDKDLRHRVARLINDYHTSLSPVIGYEERLLFAELEKASAPEAQQFFERIVKTLHTREGAFVDAVRVWIDRLAQRQHRDMWQNEVLSAAWGVVHLSQLREGKKVTLPPGFQLSRINWLLGLGKTPKRYTLRQRGRVLYLESDVLGTLAGDLDAPGSPLAEISAMDPYVQVQRIKGDDLGNDEQSQAIDQSIPLHSSGRLRIRTDRDELILDSFSRPAWAEAIGRDAQGLFVAWQDQQRRARWLNPGSYPVYNLTGECLGQLTMASGYWRNEAEGLAQLRKGFPQPDWVEDYGLDAYGLYADFRVHGVTQRLRWITPGEFWMGSPRNETERNDDEMQHQVILTRGYWLADTACTQRLWQAVMGNIPSRFQGEDRPVERVSWDKIPQFIERLNELVPSGGFRLPTEAEWEYACRAGTETPFWFGNQITPEQVNYNGEYPYARGQKGRYRAETVAVKALLCNDWGLYQMHGNVWEWCQDWYGVYPMETVVDPMGPVEGEERVLRGGSWLSVGGLVRSAFRSHFNSGYSYDFVGFRLARD